MTGRVNLSNHYLLRHSAESCVCVWSFLIRTDQRFPFSRKTRVVRMVFVVDDFIPLYLPALYLKYLVYSDYVFLQLVLAPFVVILKTLHLNT